MGGPLLLVGTDSIHSVVADELARLKPARIVVQGGAAAVGDAVVNQLRHYTTGTITRNAGATRYETAALGFEAVRLGGTDRYETSALVGEWVRARAGYGSTALAATGKTFPDGLTAGVLAGTWNAPVLLTNGTCWSPATKSFLDRLNPARVTILGGLAAQGPGVASLTTCP